jgi:hypothetical protein
VLRPAQEKLTSMLAAEEGTYVENRMYRKRLAALKKKIHKTEKKLSNTSSSDEKSTLTDDLLHDEGAHEDLPTS